ncbi:nuclear transport factor 2 family protein [Amycolatopsis japonica]|uniref:nuclear transport factor 2 family protein n=1 Tax=Amycolatopsis japonica TaxID=208439 RepID=UPI00366DDE00
MTDLRTLLDEREINQTLSRMTRILDKRDWDSLDTVFAEDLTFDYGRGERAGIKEMREEVSGFLAHCGPTLHLLGSGLIEIDGDTARTEVYVLARHQGGGKRSHLYFDATGPWIDRWERRASGWRIVRRDISLNVLQGDPAALGSDALPQAMAE